jgi:hypothetical protein
MSARAWRSALLLVLVLDGIVAVAIWAVLR